MNHKLNEKEMATVAQYQIAINMATEQLRSYLNGLLDGHGLTGNWFLSRDGKELIKQEQAEANPQPDVIPELKILKKEDKS